ncbi:MAG: type 12 methyltransferase [Phage 67_12]|nr:MAG: type 12 methyltransferase [Phage 67_12]
MHSPAPSFLADFPLDDGVRIISPPQNFDGGEEQYDLNIGGAQRADLVKCGRGAWQLAARYVKRPIGTVLEIGAGSGTCTLGLIAEAGEASIVVTDTSPKFLRMIDAKLKAASIPRDGVSLATLAGEDLSLLAADSFDVIVIASALHHVGDWKAFMREAARILTPGGVLVIQEPCREGNLMMGMIIDVALATAWSPAQSIPDADRVRLATCRDSIYFLANSHIEKVGEDKHSFLATELAAVADEAGFMRTAFYSNAHFQDLSDSDLSQRQRSSSLLEYLDAFLEHHHRVSPDGMAKLRASVFPMFKRVDATFRAGDGVPLLGCGVFCK